MFALVLSPFVSHPMSPFVFPFCWLACPPSRYLVSTFPPLSRPHMCACVGWCICILDVLSLPCLPMFPIVFPHVCLCWMVRPPSWRLVSHCLPTCVPVLDGLSAFPRSRLPFSPLLSHWAHCLALSPHTFACVGWWVCLPWRVVFPFCLRLSLHMCACDGMSAFSGLSLVCHCLPLSPHMCLCWMVCLPSRGLSACLRLSPHNMRLCWMVCPPSQGLVSPCRLPSFPCFNGVPAFSRSCLPWSPIAPHSLPLSPRMCAPVLDGVSAFPTSCFRIVSHCPHMCACVGWCVRLPEVLSPLVSLLVYPCLRLSPRASHCLPLSPVACNCFPLSPHMCLCWMVHLPEVLVFITSHCLPRYVWPVLHGASTFPRSCLPLVSHCLPSCFPVLDGVSTFPMFCLLCLLCLPACLPSCLPACLPTCLSSCFPLWWVVWFCIFSNSVLLGWAFLRCPPWCWMVCPPSRGLVSYIVSQFVSLLVSL